MRRAGGLGPGWKKRLPTIRQEGEGRETEDHCLGCRRTGGVGKASKEGCDAEESFKRSLEKCPFH